MTVWSNRILIVLGALGIFVAGVLAYATWQKLEVPCGTNAGCSIVQASAYAKFPAGTGVPVAYLGLLGYVGLFSFAVVRSLVTGKVHRRLSIAGFAMAGVGMLFSLYLTYRSFADVNAKCLWCLASLGVIVLTFIAHAALLQGEEPSKSDFRPGLAASALAMVLALVGIGVRVQGLRTQIDMVSDLANPEGFALKDVLPIPAKVRGGTDSAKVTILEFADMNCGTCRSIYPDVHDVVEKYDGKVRLAFRHFPLIGLGGHETSLDAAVISEIAADKGLFWKYLDLVMNKNNQDRIKSLDGLIAVAGEAGLSRGEIVTLFNSQDPENKKLADSYYERVNADMALGQKMVVTGTPALFVFAEGIKPKAVSANRLGILLSESPYRELLQ